MHRAVPTQTKPRFAHLQEARAARLKHAQPAADSQAHLGHPPYPASLTRDFRHIGPRLSGREVDIHITESQSVIDGKPLRTSR